jgi:uncharacterized protein with ParB-like and HNH nuclease domain
MNDILNNSDTAFKPETKNIEKLFCDADSFYLIPNYQRPYSWGDDQIEQLWDDLMDSMEPIIQREYPIRIFLGPIILKRQKTDITKF